MKEMTLAQVAKAVGGTLQAGDAACGVPLHEARIDGVETDSRNDLRGKLFIPLKGTRNDGHDYIDAAFSNGATAALSERNIAADKPVITVNSTATALQNLAMAYKSSLPVKTVAVTGSVGKTTTKDMIAAVLSEKYSVLKTDGNFNNEIGLPLTIFRLEERHQFAVLEMGMNHFGEIRNLSRIAKPDICVITNIGVSHIENLGSREGILQAKTEIFEHMNPQGEIVLNGDDDLLLALKDKFPRSRFYGLNPDNDIFAADLTPKGIESTDCRIHYGNACFGVTVPFPGRHMVQNALAAVAIGVLAGVSPEEMKRGIENFQLSKMRIDIQNTGNGVVVINDAYNASPDSAKAAIDILARSEGNKVCILGDMLELGKFSRQMHEDVGRYAAENGIDVIVFVGDNSFFAYHEAIRRTARKVFYFPTQEQLLENVTTLIKTGDTVLVKASRGMGLEATVTAILNYADFN